MPQFFILIRTENLMVKKINLDEIKCSSPATEMGGVMACNRAWLIFLDQTVKVLTAELLADKDIESLQNSISRLIENSQILQAWSLQSILEEFLTYVSHHPLKMVKKKRDEMVKAIEKSKHEFFIKVENGQIGNVFPIDNQNIFKLP